ncbi:MAG: hypothetical protein QM734_01715 [Cyclobacteriaceae bacterium]
MAKPPIIYIAKYLPIIEKVLLAAFVSGFIMKLMQIGPANDIIIISLSALSAIYFLTAQIPLDVGESAIPSNQEFSFRIIGEKLTPKILAIGSSCSVIGILFTIMQWSGFREMLLIGSISLAFSSVLALLVSSISNEYVRKTIGQRLLRAVPLMLIGFYLLWEFGLTDPNFQEPE